MSKAMLRIFAGSIAWPPDFMVSRARRLGGQSSAQMTLARKRCLILLSRLRSNLTYGSFRLAHISFLGIIITFPTFHMLLLASSWSDFDT